MKAMLCLKTLELFGQQMQNHISEVLVLKEFMVFLYGEDVYVFCHKLKKLQWLLAG
jgi:hypothetical protein